MDVHVRRSFRLLVGSGFQLVGPHQSPFLRRAYRGKEKGGSAIARDHVIALSNSPCMHV